MLSRTELETIKATILTLAAGGSTATVATALASLEWAIQAETEIEDMRAAGAFKCPTAYRRERAKQGQARTPRQVAA